MLFWKQIQAWIESDSQESPVLVVGPANARWDDFLTDFKEKSGLRPEDMLEMERENHAIKIKEIRELLSQIGSTSFSGKRIVIIPEAERLRRETANALLKELEDSSKTNRWLLTTGYRGRLLPTIISRCQILRLPAEYAAEAADAMPSPSEVLARVGDLSRKQLLKEDEITEISEVIQSMVMSGNSSTDLQRALLRLRDYHKIRALGGSEKMASDVLVASLAQLRKYSV